MKRIIISWLLMLSLSAFATDALAAMKQGRYQRLVKKISMSDSFDYSAVSIAGVKTDTYAAYEKLEKRASKAQITALWTHPSAIVRAYAWKAYLSRYPSDWLNQAPAHFDDPSLFMVQQGCIVQTQSLGDILSEWFRDTFRISLHQQKQDDSAQKVVMLQSQRIALFHALKGLPNGSSANSGRVLAHLVSRWQVPLSFAADLRRLVDQGLSEAFIPLARLKDEADLPLFLEQLRDQPTKGLLSGIKQWPHERLLPPLLARYRQAVSTRDVESQTVLYPALAAFHHPDITRVFMDLIQVVDRPDHPHHHQVRDLFAVLTSSPATLTFFEEAVLAMARRGQLMNRAMWNHLATHNTAAANALMSWFIRDTDLNQTGEHLDAMMHQLTRLRPSGYIELMNLALRKVSVFEADHVLTHLTPYKHRDTFDILAARLDRETDVFFRHEAAKAMKRIDRQRAYAFLANQRN